MREQLFPREPLWGGCKPSFRGGCGLSQFEKLEQEQRSLEAVMPRGLEEVRTSLPMKCKAAQD